MTNDSNLDIDCDTSSNFSDRQSSETNSLERADMSDMIASHLRDMSEHALHAGLDNSSCLIEAAALVVEMEGRKPRHG
jgi:hypothetical protein